MHLEFVYVIFAIDYISILIYGAGFLVLDLILVSMSFYQKCMFTIVCLPLLCIVQVFC